MHIIMISHVDFEPSRLGVWRHMFLYKAWLKRHPHDQEKYYFSSCIFLQGNRQPIVDAIVNVHSKSKYSCVAVLHVGLAKSNSFVLLNISRVKGK